MVARPSSAEATARHEDGGKPHWSRRPAQGWLHSFENRRAVFFHWVACKRKHFDKLMLLCPRKIECSIGHVIKD
jgi:hypothetical protein